MRLLAPLSCLLPCLLLVACSHQPAAAVSPASTASYILVRHAEKDVSVAKDPPLTDAGKARAERMADRLREVPLAAVYSSPYRRTRDTALPTAQRHGLPVIEYDPGDATAFAAQLRHAQPRGNVLVVGHSNTLPPLARALCGCTVADMDEAIYGIGYTIAIDGDGRAHLTESRD